jgi:hypothetical protein
MNNGSHRLSSLVLWMLSATLAFVCRSAHADVPPPDSCNSAGTACNVAGPNYDQPGTCVDSTCTRATPGGPVSYACLRCEIGADSGGGAGGGASNGAGGAPATSGGAANGGGAPSGGASGAKSSGKHEDDGGCEISRSRHHDVAPILGIGLALVVLGRRRR